MKGSNAARRRSAAVVWMSVAFATGVASELGSGPSAWVPAVGALGAAVASHGLVGVGVGLGVAAGRWTAHGQSGAQVLSLPWAGWFLRAQRSLDQRIQSTVHPAVAPLATAMISGRRGDLTSGERQAFVRSGTAHLLAISGFHVGVVGGLVALAAALLGATLRFRAGIAATVVWTYVLVIGAPASALRAAALLTVFTVGRMLGRPTRRLPALSSVFLLWLLYRPASLSGIGFQLSFAASLGIVATRAWPGGAWAWVQHRGPEWLIQRRGRAFAEATVRGAAVAAGATLPTVPLVGFAFGEVSVVSIPATLLAMPLAAASIAAVLFAVVLGVVWPPAGAVVGANASMVLGAFRMLVEAWAAPPFATVRTDGPTAVTVAVTLTLAYAIVRRGTRPRVAVLAIVLCATSAHLGVSTWGRMAGAGILELTFIDVGQGDATLIRTPRGRWVLVDAGPALRGWNAGERRIAPLMDRLGVARLEVLVLTHADADHIGGAAAILSHVAVKTVADPGGARGASLFVAALTEAQQSGTPWRVARAGTRWSMDGVVFEVLAPGRRDDARLPKASSTSSTNAESVVLLVRYGEFEALLTGDAPAEVEEHILEALPTRVEVLKVGHHGSATSTHPRLLERTRPALAVISVGARNRYGHPAPSVVRRLLRHRAQILRTDTHGTVRVRGRRNGDFSATPSRAVR